MKPQDVVFVTLLLLLLCFKNPRWFALAGVLCLFLSIPLFALWTFFTAERLTWYAAAFFLISAVKLYKSHE